EQVFDPPASSSPPESAEHSRGERLLIGLPWDDLAPDRDMAALETAATVSQHPLHSTLMVESPVENAPIGCDEPPPAASTSLDYPSIPDETHGEIAVESNAETPEAADSHTDSDRSGEESETIETIDGDELEEDERRRSRTFRQYKIQEVI